MVDHIFSHCQLFVVIVTCGLLSGVVSQYNAACYDVTGRNDTRFFENSCFWKSHAEGDKSKWDDAQQLCKTWLNGNLATVATKKTLNFLLSNLSLSTGVNYWIGLYINKTDLPDTNDMEKLRNALWKWIDGTPYDRQSGLGWHKDEPGNGETWGRLRELKWAGIKESQDDKYPFICETKLPQSTTTQTTTTNKPEDTTQSGDTSPQPDVTPPQQRDDTSQQSADIPQPNGVLGPALGAVLGVIVVAAIVVALFVMRNRIDFGKLINKRNSNAKRSKNNDTTVENGHSNPVATTSQSTLITSNVERPIAKTRPDAPAKPSSGNPTRPDAPAKPSSGNPTRGYATVNPKRASINAARIYETVGVMFGRKPKVKKATSLENVTSDQPYENTYISTVVRVEELNDWVKEATSSGLIEDQYKSIPAADPNELKKYCNQQHFKPKNRYKNMVPYDSNRVELSTLPNEPYSHYINASYINSYTKKKTFIAAQGPTVHTVSDFWRMIWEKSVRTVVMVSNQTESQTGKMNFVQYWPKGKDKETFGVVQVAIKKVENLPDYLVRHMAVSKGTDITIVKQYHFKAWPDHGVPKHAMALINFREKIRKEMSKSPKNPVLVHCSAGVGRTGTFIAIDYLLQQAAKEGVVDFVSCLRKLRQQRTDMMQKVTQYQFVIRAVLEALTLGQTAIPCSEYAETLQTFRDPLTDGETRIQKQFEMLVHYFTVEKGSDESTINPAKLPENANNNRDKRVLPASSKRVILMTPVSGHNDYINAVFVDGHRRKNAYIATHAPLQNTVVDLWRAVFDYNSTVIVMLCPKYYLKTAEVYYPEGLGDQMDVTPFELECLEEDENRGVRRTQLSLKYCGLEKNVLHFSLMEDMSAMSTEEKMTTISSIYENVKKWQQQQTEKKAPVTVHCLEGTEWTGLYCVLCNLFDQINEEQEVDVFHAVGQSRLARKEFVSSMKQYETIYDILHLYMDQFKIYSNFQ